MKKLIVFLAAIILVFSAGCNQQTDYAVNDDTAEQQEQSEQAADTSNGGADYSVLDSEDFLQMLSDWVLGTDYGIDGIQTDSVARRLLISIDEDKQAALEDFEYDDIAFSMADMLSYSGVDPEGFVLMWPDGRTTELGESTVSEADSDMEQGGEVAEQGSEESSGETAAGGSNENAVNLIFIHHSCGENWLNDGLNEMLNDSGFHVADTYYGWDDMGDRTDTVDWPDWFVESYMPRVYAELDTETASNTIEAAPGENEIVMFKSCYPNSDVGGSIDDEKAIYNSLLSYFGAHPDKMFILVTPPPMQHISSPEKTRELTDWLVDGWLSGYDTGNVFVYDLYNVLTAPDNHHYFDGSSEVHVVSENSNTLYYDSDGDDHPNREGNTKAAGQFVPLLEFWYGQFKGR